ncbi:CapA family protein, partial [Akkermansiaceae bacterium]|nr:CapA family protein [Akkermansiaceae bacterium]
MKKTIRVAFLGDIAGNDSCAETLRRVPAKEFFAPVSRDLDDCDLVIANLEGAFNDGGTLIPFGEKTHIVSDPSVVEALKVLSVSAVSTANNHSFDFGVEGWKMLGQNLREQGIASFGGGTSDEAARPWIHRSEAGAIGVIGLADPECGACFASEDSSGVNKFDMQRTR